MIETKNIKIKNIYYMLAYAFQVLKEDNYAKIALEEDFEYVEDLLAAILAKGIANQIKRGLGREYISFSEFLSSPRGKIDISTSLKERSLLKKKLVCEFDELSENTYTNQILKTAAMLLIKSDKVAAKYKKALKKIIRFFIFIDALKIPCKIKRSSIKYHRNNATYEMLINICYLVFEALLPTVTAGQKKWSHFKKDHLPRLFEKFVLGYYRKEFPRYKAKPAQIDWNVGDNYFDLLPVMQSDITLTYMDKILIIDTKFYSQSMQVNRFNSRTIRSGNLYQIFTYVKNKDIDHTGNVSGVILYAKTDEEITPDNSYLIDGNKISVKTLDLSKDFEGIKLQLNKIVDEWPH